MAVVCVLRMVDRDKGAMVGIFKDRNLEICG